MKTIYPKDIRRLTEGGRRKWEVGSGELVFRLPTLHFRLCISDLKHRRLVKGILFLLCFLPMLAFSQGEPTAQQIIAGKHDPITLYLADEAAGHDADRWIEWGEKASQLAAQLDTPEGKANATLLIAIGCIQKEDLQRAMHLMEQALEIFEANGKEKGRGEVLCFIALVHNKRSELSKGIEYLQQAISLYRKSGNQAALAFGLTKLGDLYAKAYGHAKALPCYQESLQLANEMGNTKQVALQSYKVGKAYSHLGEHTAALSHLNRSLRLSEASENKLLIAATQSHIGAVHRELGSHDSARIYLEASLELAQQAGHFEQIKHAAEQLAGLFEERGNHQQAIRHQKVYQAATDALNEGEKSNNLARMKNDFTFEMELLQQKELLRREQSRLQLSMGGLGGALLLLLVLFRYYQQKKENLEALKIKNAEILEARNQLIVQEKLALLGQMAAGIAHEIKNPLNFVNNFAEGSLELTEELLEEMKKKNLPVGSKEFSTIREIIDILTKNAISITQNGQRANQIVNNIMQQAQGIAGKAQKADLHQLIDENIQLAYHSCRARNPLFTLTIESNYDPNIGEITALPQGLERALLNIASNACHAMNEKLEGVATDFYPRLQVTTRNVGGYLRISIRDNGPGISEKIRDKIFNPFFTTKPADSGSAGLGLYISYDIIVGKHNGTLEVASEEGQYTEFIICLPAPGRSAQ